MLKMKKMVLPLLSVFALASCNNQNVEVKKPTDDNKKVVDSETKDEYLSNVKNDFLKDSNEVSYTDTTVTFKDANETDFTLNRGVKNTCILYSSFTTLWYEAGGVCQGVIGGNSAVSLYEEYIGRDITKDQGVSVMSISASGKKWKTEQIIASKPELIICSNNMSGYSTISGPAKAANIDCVSVQYNDLKDYLKWFKVFALLNNRLDLFDSVALKTLDDVSEVMYECNNSNLTPTNVFTMFSGTKSFQANTKNTLVGSMINSLGSINVVDTFGDAKSERIDIDFEKVYAAKPELVLIQCHDTNEATLSLLDKIYGNNDLWKAIETNVGENGVQLLEKSLYHNKPNHKFAEAYQKLAKILYPTHTFSFEVK